MRVERTYVQYQLVLELLATGFVGAIGIGALWYWHQGQYLPWLAVVAGLWLIASLGLAFLYVKHARLRFFDDQQALVVQRGRLIQRKVYVPYAKIYAVSERQDVLQKLWDLKDVEVQTAAKAYTVSGLSPANVEAILAHWDQQREELTDAV